MYLKNNESRRLLMRKFTFALLLLILLVSVGACSNGELVSLEPIRESSSNDLDWTKGLEKGVYLKKISTNEGILYVNLNSGGFPYTTIDANVEHSEDKVKIMISERDAYQDSEVTYEYHGKLASDEGLGNFEVYLNGDKVNVTIIE